jgi:hypothetical protein
MTTKLHRSAQQTWNAITRHIKLQAKDAYYRALDFDERINYIQMCMLSRASQTDTCRLFTGSDTLLHRLVECGNGPEQWAWVQERKAAVLRMDNSWIPDTWLKRPQLTLWPPRRSRAILWMFEHLAVFRVTLNSDRTNTEFLTYLRRAITTIYQHLKRLPLVEN